MPGRPRSPPMPGTRSCTTFGPTRHRLLGRLRRQDGPGRQCPGRSGAKTTDVGALWGFEVAQASAALSPVRYLAGAVDAAAPAPGLPLVFSRTYGEDLVSRFKQGPLGRGWSTNWDIQAQVLDNGDVVIHGPGGADRFFTHNASGSYTALPGDYGRLTMSDGTIQLSNRTGPSGSSATTSCASSTSFKTPTANRITLGYDSYARLTSLTHSSGRQFLLEYAPPDFGMDPSQMPLRTAHGHSGSGHADDRMTTYRTTATANWIR